MIVVRLFRFLEDSDRRFILQRPRLNNEAFELLARNPDWIRIKENIDT